MMHNILLVCSGVLSSTLLVNEMADYYKEIGHSLNISACGIYEYERYIFNADVVLLGPQVAYKANEVAEFGKPVICLNSYDYTLCNIEKIKEVIDDVYEKRLKPKK